MECRTSFKINIALINDDSMYQIIDEIGVDAGVTEGFLYYGLMKRDTEDENYSLYDQLNDTLSIIYNKVDILNNLKTRFNIWYEVNVHFTDIEEEIIRNTSFTIAKESSDFISSVDAYYNLNNGYFDN